MEKGQREISHYPRLSEHPAQECRSTTRSKYAVHPQMAAFLERARPGECAPKDSTTTQARDI
jgi:hypothetical protein